MQSSRLIQQAEAAIQNGRFHEARRLLQQALQQDPDNPHTWKLLARVTPSSQAAQEYLQRADQLQAGSTAVQRSSLPPRRAANPPAPVQTAAKTTQPSRTIIRLLIAAAAGLLLALCIAALLFGRAFWEVEETAVVAANNAAGLVNLSSDQTPSAPNDFMSENLAALSALVRGETPIPTATYTPIPTNTLPPTPTLAPTFTPSPTATPLPTIPPTFASSAYSENGRPAVVGPNERWIDVDISSQTLVAYEGDTPVFNSLISGGTSQFPTVEGQFRTYMKYEQQTMNGYLLGYDYFLPDVPYVMYFYNDYAIHGAYWHNNFGVPMSHGCVNMEPTEAGWLFNWAPVGTLVNVHS